MKASREVAAEAEGDSVASARSESLSVGSDEEAEESSGRCRLKLKQMVWRMRRSMPIKCGRCASCVCGPMTSVHHAVYTKQVLKRNDRCPLMLRESRFTLGSPSPPPLPPSIMLWTCQAAIWMSRSFFSVSSSLAATSKAESETSCRSKLGSGRPGRQISGPQGVPTWYAKSLRGK